MSVEASGYVITGAIFDCAEQVVGLVSKVVSSDACAQGWEHPRKRYWL